MGRGREGKSQNKKEKKKKKQSNAQFECNVRREGYGFFFNDLGTPTRRGCNPGSFKKNFFFFE